MMVDDNTAAVLEQLKELQRAADICAYALIAIAVLAGYIAWRV